MSAILAEMISRWRLDEGRDVDLQIAALLEQAQAAGLLRASTNAVLLGEQYHLGGAEDTRRMASALGITSTDRVIDLACYVGGPARHLARECGCSVVGVDFSKDCIAVARKLTELCHLDDRVEFTCCDADAVPEPDGSFTVAWSQCSFPADLSWLPEISRLLAGGARLAFTGLIRRGPTSDPALLSLDEVSARVAGCGYRVVEAEDISEMDLEYGWLVSRQKLETDEAHYRSVFGDDWVRQGRAELDKDTAAWQSGREGNGRIVAMKL
jgi:SAM-dependent methyltransferase